MAARVAAALRGVADSGVPVGIIVGNRDFLLGPRFAEAAGATLLPEQIVVDVAGTPTLLMHGDELCTSDVAYQRFRADHARSAAGSASFLALPYAPAARHWRTGCAARAAPRPPSSRKPSSTSNPAPSTAAFREANVARIIHGHTHRPAHHRLVVDGRACERYVLADWYDRGSYLEFDAGRRGEDAASRADAHGSPSRLRSVGDACLTASACVKSAIRSSRSSMPDRDADQRIGDAHLRATLGAHLPEDRVRDRYRERPVVAEIRRRHDDAEAIQEIEAVDAVGELEREEPAERAEQRARERMLRVRRQARVVDLAHPRDAPRETRRAPARSRTCAPSAARASRRRPRCGCASPAESVASPVAQPLLADLLDSPQRRRLRLVVLGDVGIARSSRRGRCP